RAGAHRLDRLLPAGRGQGHLPEAGWLDPATPALPDLAPVEAAENTSGAPDATRARRGACMAIRLQRTRPLVECRGQPHARRLPGQRLPLSRVGWPTRPPPPPQ